MGGDRGGAEGDGRRAEVGVQEPGRRRPGGGQPPSALAATRAGGRARRSGPRRRRGCRPAARRRRTAVGVGGRRPSPSRASRCRCRRWRPRARRGPTGRCPGPRARSTRPGEPAGGLHGSPRRPRAARRPRCRRCALRASDNPENVPVACGVSAFWPLIVVGARGLGADDVLAAFCAGPDDGGDAGRADLDLRAGSPGGVVGDVAGRAPGLPGGLHGDLDATGRDPHHRGHAPRAHGDVGVRGAHPGRAHRHAGDQGGDPPARRATCTWPPATQAAAALPAGSLASTTSEPRGGERRRGGEPPRRGRRGRHEHQAGDERADGRGGLRVRFTRGPSEGGSVVVEAAGTVAQDVPGVGVDLAGGVEAEVGLERARRDAWARRRASALGECVGVQVRPASSGTCRSTCPTRW